MNVDKNNNQVFDDESTDLLVMTQSAPAGYFSITDELIDTINSFDKYKVINWKDIKTITDKF